MISYDQLQQLKKYFATLPVDVVYLFGSQANGKATNLSDADIAVLFKEGLSKSKRFDLRLEMITRVCSLLKKEQVDVLDLDEAPLALQYSAIFPKNIILVKNINRMMKLEKSTVKLYLDLQPYLYNIAKRQLAIIAQKGFKNE